MKKRDNTTIFRPPELGGIEIRRVIGSRHVFPKHVHDDIYTLSLMEEGATYCVGPEKNESVVTAGEVALINPGQVHSGVPAGCDRISYWVIHITYDLMTELFEDVFEKDGAGPEFRSMVVHDPLLRNHLRLLFYRLTEPAGELERETALLESLACLLVCHCSDKRPAAPGHAPHVVRHAKEYLSEDLARKLSLDEVAGAVGLSRYHFLRTFKKSTGLPPHVFRTQCRIDLSQKLMRQGMPFSQVALEAGFNDQSHFTKRFRQFTGVTPRQYMGRLVPVGDVPESFGE